jgi:hypothetical protein
MRAATTTPVEPMELVARFFFPIGAGLPRYYGESASTLARFEACSVFTHVAARIARFAPYRAIFPECFKSFVAS